MHYISGSLRFRVAEHPVRAANPWRGETGQPERPGADHSDAGAEGHEPVQARGRGRAPLPVPNQRSLPGDHPRQGRLPGAGESHQEPGWCLEVLFFEFSREF